MNFYIDRVIQDHAPYTRLGVLVVEGAKVGFGHASLDGMRLRVANKLRDEIRSSQSIKLVPQIAGLDQLLGKFDPNPRRPMSSVESLLLRVLEGGPLPVENDAVDAAQLLSMYYKLPVFIADRRDLRGDVGLVVGRGDRAFETIQGVEPIRTEGRLFCADDLGYFASPLAAGKRAAVTERSTDLLLMALFPENVGDSIVRDFIRRGGNWLESLCKGQVVEEGMVGEPEAASA